MDIDLATEQYRELFLKGIRQKLKEEFIEVANSELKTMRTKFEAMMESLYENLQKRAEAQAEAVSLEVFRSLENFDNRVHYKLAISVLKEGGKADGA